MYCLGNSNMKKHLFITDASFRGTAYLYVCMCTMCVQATRKTEKGMVSPYTEIICNSKPYNVDAGNELRSLPRAALFFFSISIHSWLNARI